MAPVHSRVSRGKKITLSLTDKVKLLDLHKQKPKLGCHPLGELFKETSNIEIGKSQIANILKNESNIRREYENFEGDAKRKKIAKYDIINYVLYEWYIKCCQACICPDGAMLQEEALKIKTELNDSNLGDFKASNGWLEHFKKRFSLRQTRIVGEAGDVPITTNKTWMERLPKIIQGYSADDIWNMDESGRFFKALPDTGLAKKTKKRKAGKKSKARLTVAFFLSSSGFKLCKPVVIGKSKVPRCLRNLPNPSKLNIMQYFHSKNALMTTEIMIQVLTALDHKLDVKNRKVLLLLDNAPSHPETLQKNLKNIKLVFLPKNTSSQLQPCDAGIIGHFKVKYRKQLLKHVISRIKDRKKASEIIQRVDLLQCMRWVNQAFEHITKDTKNVGSQKCLCLPKNLMRNLRSL